VAIKFEYDIFTVAWRHGASSDPINTPDESPDDDRDDEVVMFVAKRTRS